MDRINEWMGAVILRLQELRSREDGQGLIEYGLILALIAVVCIVVLTNIGQSISSYLQSLANQL